MRADIESETMPDLCNILTLTQTSDGAGGFTDAWGTLLTNVSCRVDPIRGGEALAAGAVNDYNTMRLTVPYDTGLTVQHRVEHDGATYNVRSVSSGSWMVSQRAIVERV